MIWRNPQQNLLLEKQLSKELKISEPVASMLVTFGIRNASEGRAFLESKLADLEDPFAITHLKEAAERLIQAINQKENVLIFGDYDVDGVTSAALLVSFLREFGLDPKYVVPFRLQEGYGLSQIAVERALAENPGIDLFISLDCGTNSLKEVQYVREQGIDVTIVDHHQSTETLPEDCVIVNPHVFDKAENPWQSLCTVGLVFKLCHGLLKLLRESEIDKAFDLKLKDYLDFVALGTIADMVPLRGENRILAKQGLSVMSDMKRPGLQALFQVSGISIAQEIKPSDVSFRLGPRINASGRLADAILPINLLLNDNYEESLKLAQQLDAMNKERQAIERTVTEQAISIVEKEGQHTQEAILVYNEDWHFGVVGIVAGRLSRLYHRPTLVLGSECGYAKGSGRSIEGINLVDVLKECDELLHIWGGHPAAIGLSLDPNNLDALYDRFLRTVQAITPEGLPEPSIDIAYWIDVNELTTKLLDELDLLHPFGMDNPEPIFGLKGVTLEKPADVFANKHWRFRLNTDKQGYIGGIAWNMAERIPALRTPIDMAVRFNWNHWNGKSYPQIELVDWRESLA
ncbi:MAG: single-stranded-DNA-specific exonuclease RecJ [Verrucomicrobia bacterium CG1_02_43_26]|nr:MAG: single-stranded-DNA-specific exonuclease RecJ [Verrucomicrobia bacterium CG1_02_43_26]